MKYIILLSFIIFSGCSSMLMRCPDKVTDADILKCSEPVSGFYRKCEKPIDLFRCTVPE